MSIFQQHIIEVVDQIVLYILCCIDTDWQTEEKQFLK